MSQSIISTEITYPVQAALPAKGVLATGILGQADQQGVVFIKQGGVGGQIVREKVLIGGIAVALRRQAEAVDDAAGVGVNDESRFVGGIQDYGVGGLRPDAVDGKKPGAEAVNNI